MINSISNSSIHQYSATSSTLNNQSMDNVVKVEKSSSLYSDKESSNLISNEKLEETSDKIKKYTIAQTIASMESGSYQSIALNSQKLNPMGYNEEMFNASNVSSEDEDDSAEIDYAQITEDVTQTNYKTQNASLVYDMTQNSNVGEDRFSIHI